MIDNETLARIRESVATMKPPPRRPQSAAEFVARLKYGAPGFVDEEAANRDALSRARALCSQEAQRDLMELGLKILLRPALGL